MNGFVQNTVFSPSSKGLRFLHFAHHSLAIFRKVHEFVQINVLSPISARFLVFALGTPLLRIFSKVHGLYKTAFSARYQHVFSFLHWGHHFLEFSVNCTSLYKTEVFSTRSARFVIFAFGAPLFSAFQQRFQPDISTSSHFCTGDTSS